MNLSNQSKTLSKMTGSDIDRKIKSDINFRKNISKNMDFGELSKSRKAEILKNIELDKLKKYVDNISVYEKYNAAQISNIYLGYENGVDISFYDNSRYSANDMALRRMILFYNKNHPDAKFDLNFFNGNNANKVALLFEVFKYNVNNPNNPMDLNLIINEYDISKIKQLFEKHKNNKPLPVGPIREVAIEQPKKVLKPKEKEKPVQKDIKDMSFGELADLWNEKHPNLKINAELIHQQPNPKRAEMLYVTSLYNLKFKNDKIPLNVFTGTSYDAEQKDEILAGIKYNLKNVQSPIPVKKYMHNDISSTNMHIINKIMRLMAEYDVDANIDYIITNCTNTEQLNRTYDNLFKNKKEK